LPFCIVYLWYGAYIQVQVQVEAAPGPESLDGRLKAVSWSWSRKFERAPTHLLGAAVNTEYNRAVGACWLADSGVYAKAGSAWPGHGGEGSDRSLTRRERARGWRGGVCAEMAGG
jgi:hypothetical protein